MVWSPPPGLGPVAAYGVADEVGLHRVPGRPGRGRASPNRPRPEERLAR
jgi:hypothetical protein